MCDDRRGICDGELVICVYCCGCDEACGGVSCDGGASFRIMHREPYGCPKTTWQIPYYGMGLAACGQRQDRKRAKPERSTQRSRAAEILRSAVGCPDTGGGPTRMHETRERRASGAMANASIELADSVRANVRRPTASGTQGAQLLQCIFIRCNATTYQQPGACGPCAGSRGRAYNLVHPPKKSQ